MSETLYHITDVLAALNTLPDPETAQTMTYTVNVARAIGPRRVMTQQEVHAFSPIHVTEVRFRLHDGRWVVDGRVAVGRD